MSARSRVEQSCRDGWLAVSDGLRLHYRDYRGSAVRPPLLCLPGLTRNARDFEDFAERYAPRFRVLALDFRGRGLSDRDPQPLRYNPFVYAGDVVRLLDQLAIARAVFVGTSLGGIVTMVVATAAPQRIVGAVLNDVGPALSADGLDRIRSYVGKGQRFADWDDAARAIATNNRHIPKSFGHDDWLKFAHRACREQEGVVVFDYDPAIALPFRTAASAPPVDMWPMFRALAQQPLLVLRGEHSDLLDDAAFDRMKKAAPDARFVVVPEAGHAPSLDEPSAIVAIDALLGDIAP
jgi:pimeloyl-ACP methyl ester carboxylesterase